MKYYVTYSGNSTRGFEFESNSRNALKHLRENYQAAGDDKVCVYINSAIRADLKKYGYIHTAPLSMARYSPEMGGKFYRC